MTKRTTCRPVDQWLLAAMFVIAITFGLAAVASAEPDSKDYEWDVDAYDLCVALGARSVVECCADSGGLPVGPPYDDPDHSCQAPTAQSQQTGPARSPEEIVGGPVRDFNVPDASVPDAPVIVLPTP